MALAHCRGYNSLKLTVMPSLILLYSVLRSRIYQITNYVSHACTCDCACVLVQTVCTSTHYCMYICTKDTCAHCAVDRWSTAIDTIMCSTVQRVGAEGYTCQIGWNYCSPIPLILIRGIGGTDALSLYY